MLQATLVVHAQYIPLPGYPPSSYSPTKQMGFKLKLKEDIIGLQICECSI